MSKLLLRIVYNILLILIINLLLLLEILIVCSVHIGGLHRLLSWCHICLIILSLIRLLLWRHLSLILRLILSLVQRLLLWNLLYGWVLHRLLVIRVMELLIWLYILLTHRLRHLRLPWLPWYVCMLIRVLWWLHYGNWLVVLIELLVLIMLSHLIRILDQWCTIITVQILLRLLSGICINATRTKGKTLVPFLTGCKTRVQSLLCIGIVQLALPTKIATESCKLIFLFFFLYFLLLLQLLIGTHASGRIWLILNCRRCPKRLLGR